MRVSSKRISQLWLLVGGYFKKFIEAYAWGAITLVVLLNVSAYFWLDKLPEVVLFNSLMIPVICAISSKAATLGAHGSSAEMYLEGLDREPEATFSSKDDSSRRDKDIHSLKKDMADVYDLLENVYAAGIQAREEIVGLEARSDRLTKALMAINEETFDNKELVEKSRIKIGSELNELQQLLQKEVAQRLHCQAMCETLGQNITDLEAKTNAAISFDEIETNLSAIDEYIADRFTIIESEISGLRALVQSTGEHSKTGPGAAASPDFNPNEMGAIESLLDRVESLERQLGRKGR